MRALIEAVGVATFCVHELAQPDDNASGRDDRAPRGSRYSWRRPRMWNRQVSVGSLASSAAAA